jgi:DNA (cytosine-5)-methyltransferase 1
MQEYPIYLLSEQEEINMGLFVDNFAGGGGASTGIELAIGRNVDIAINHDPDAIAMHRANHPNSKHYCEDVWEVDPVEACEGQPVTLAWFSPDCKHFSRAKGGKPADKNIRGLAWVAVKWAYLVRPSVIMLENVPEIQTWGPLGADNRPIKERSGETFHGFIKALTTGIPADHPAFSEMCEALSITGESDMAKRLIDGLGYDIEYRTLRSCDYGAPTTRTRFYMIARCDGRPIVWPKPTHGHKNSPEVKAGKKKPYHTAAECIDWSIPAQSIFERDRPLADNTLRRIARGIQRFVIDNPEPFIVTVNHGGDGFRGQSINEPLQTVTAKHGYGIVTPTIMCNNGNNVGASVESPLPTVTTGNRNFLVAPTLIQYHSETSEEEVRGQEIDKPLMTVDTAPRYALSCAHIMKNYGGGYTGAGSSADAPLDTVTATDHNSLVTAHIMTMRNHMCGQPMDEPLGTITAGTTHHLEVQAFLLKYYGNGTANSVDEPLDTVTARDRFALVTIHGEEYIITDIRMRMLQPRELFNAQGFPEDYIIDHDADGKAYPKNKQVARCGNAVTPPVPAAMVRANLPECCTAETNAA